MRRIINIIVLISFWGCYSMYGIGLQEGKTNFLPTQAHVDYKLETTESEAPQSIIFIIYLHIIN